MTGYVCLECGRTFAAFSAAETCAQQDVYEDGLARKGRIDWADARTDHGGFEDS